jgi:hypothetical protein
MKEALDQIDNHDGSQNRDLWTKISEAISSVPNKPTSQHGDTEHAFSQGTFQRRENYDNYKNAPKEDHLYVKSDE